MNFILRTFRLQHRTWVVVVWCLLWIRWRMTMQALCLSIQSDLGAIAVDTLNQQNSHNKKSESYSGVEPTVIVIKVSHLEF